MIWKPKTGWQVVLAVPIALAFAIPSPAQHTAADPIELQRMMERANRIASIEEGKATFVAELLARFADDAAARGYDAFLQKGTRKLMAKSGEGLLELSQRAPDFDTFYKMVFEGYTMDAFGSLTQDLVFFPMSACRIYDSRIATGPLAGPMAPGTQRNVSINDFLANQGGQSPDCLTQVPDIGNDPPALAITLSAVSPTGPGNLRTFAAGAAVPLATMLTYTAGTTISTGTITSSCTACLDELTVRNQGAGNADVVIDVLGYFSAPLQTALDCTRINTAFSTAASTFAGCSSACPAGYTATGAGLLNSASSAGVEIRIMGLTNATTADFLGWNGSPSTWAGFCQVVCCRVPGR